MRRANSWISRLRLHRSRTGLRLQFSSRVNRRNKIGDNRRCMEGNRTVDIIHRGMTLVTKGNSQRMEGNRILYMLPRDKNSAIRDNREDIRHSKLVSRIRLLNRTRTTVPLLHLHRRHLARHTSLRLKDGLARYMGQIKQETTPPRR
jgi:hypothetical protein